MKYITFSIAILITLFLLTGCQFLSNVLKYRSTSIEFANHLVNKEYDQCVQLMAMEHESAKNQNVDTLKMGLDNFRSRLVDNFGDKLNYHFMKGEKSFSSETKKNDLPNTTQVFLEFSNEKEFGVFNLLFDDKSGKILNIRALDIKEPIPAMTGWWLFGLLALGVLSFNIFVIVKVKRSRILKKWQKYLAIVILNAPTFGYAAVGGFSFKFFNLQFMGVGVASMGYLGSSWSLGVPLGALYVYWKLYNGLFRTSDDEESLRQLQERIEGNDISAPPTLETSDIPEAG